MSPGTVTTIAGFTSQYKTTFSLNVAHLNAYELGYNICYLSLETPKEDINWNLLSCHSYSTKFQRYNFVSHAKMRWGTMTADEEDFIFNEVEPDYPSQAESIGYSKKVQVTVKFLVGLKVMLKRLR